MSDSSTTTDTLDTTSELAPSAGKEHEETASIPESTAPTPPRRKVYESTLIPERHRRRAPRWVILVVIAVVIGASVFFAFGSHRHRFVPTAGKVVYSAAETPGGNARLWMSGIDGSNPHVISSAAASEDMPSFSPNGDQIAYVAMGSGDARQVFIEDADGKNAQQVTNNSGSKSNPTFAPISNNLLAYTAGGRLFDLDLSANESDLLLPSDSNQNRGGSKNADVDQSQSSMAVEQFAWAPGAKKIDEQALAASVTSNLGTTEVWQTLAVMPSIDKDPIMTLPGSDNGPKVPLAVAERLTVGWSPDGGLLAVAKVGSPVIPPSGTPAQPGRPDRESTIEIFTSTGEPTQNELIPPDTFVHPGSKVVYGPEHPLFSPDGSKIVYEEWSEPDSSSQYCDGLYKVDVGGGSKPELVALGDAEKAQFTPDGQSLLYLLRRPDGGHDLMQVSMSDTTQSAPKRISDGKVDVTDFTISPQKG